jgi:hypothetical protein
MNLNDLFTELALGELNNLAMAENNTIIPSKRPQVVVAANEALLKLFSRFVLKEKDMMIEMREAVTNYHLLKRYALSQYDEDNPPDRFNMPYIVDNIGEPFLEDVIKILSVYTSWGAKLPLNDIENPSSVHTPHSTMLQVPIPIAGQALMLEYQARHTLLDHCNCNEEILLPDVLLPALKAYIASKIYSSMNTAEGTTKGQEHSLNYENHCLEVVEKDLVSSSYSTTNTKFDKRGFC